MLLGEAPTSSRRRRSALVDQRGVALPLALIVLTLLTSLTLAFLAMSASEPMIAANLKGGEQALALAEAALERAIWALSNPTVDTAGAGTNLSDLNAIPAPYNFQKLFTLNAGAGQEARVFAIQIVSSGAAPNFVTTVTGHGYVLRNGVAVPAQPGQIVASDIAAYRKLQVRVNPALKWPPGALTVAGTTSMTGTSLVDGNDSASGTPNSCPTKAGVTTITGHSITTGGSSSITGTPAQNPVASGTFNEYLLGDAELANIKALAQSYGTYVKPTSHSQFSYTPNSGLTFIDTVDGTASFGASNLADVKITSMNTGGWIIVMGSLTIDGNAGSGATFLGFIYAKDNITYKGTGSGGGISGAMISENVVTAGTTLQGNSKAYYDCTKLANGGGTLSGSLVNGLTGATVVSGSWQEVSN